MTDNPIRKYLKYEQFRFHENRLTEQEQVLVYNMSNEFYQYVSENIQNPDVHTTLITFPQQLKFLRLQNLYHRFSNNKEMFRVLDQEKRYLNIGAGAGFLEWMSREYGYNIESSDLNSSDEKIFTFMRESIGVKLDYTYNSFVSQQPFNIQGCDKRYDALLMLRFRPFKTQWMDDFQSEIYHSDDPPVDLRVLNSFKNKLIQLKRYSDEIICTVFDRHPDGDIFYYHNLESVAYKTEEAYAELAYYRLDDLIAEIEKRNG